MNEQTNGKIAAIYTRISDDRESKKYGVQRQEQDGRAEAIKRGYPHVEVYVENDVSASTKSKKPRPLFEEMMRRAEAGEVAAVIAYSSSRLTRRPLENERLIALTVDYGVPIHFVNTDDNDLTTARGRRRARDDAARDAEEAEETGERVIRASRQRAEKGWWHGGTVPYGYRAVKGEDDKLRSLVIEPTEAKVVRDIAKRILADASMYSITLDYTRRGMRTRKGNLWKAQTMRGMMLSPTIIGMRQIEGELIKAKWKPIITRKQWDQLREILTDPKRDFGPLDGAYGGKRALGGGLTKCAECGSEMVSSRLCRHNKDEHGKRRPGPRACDGNPELLAKEVRLVCQFKATGGCGKVGLNNKNYEDWVLDLVFDRLDDPTFLNAAKKPILKANDRLAALRLERKGLDARLDRAKAGLLDGIFDATEVRKIKAGVDTAKERIDKSLDSLQSDDVLAGIKSSADARELWKTASVVTKRKFIASLIEEIKVGLWPLDPENEDKPYPSTLTRWTDSSRIHKAETANEFEDRKTKHARVILRKRCEVIWRF